MEGSQASQNEQTGKLCSCMISASVPPLPSSVVNCYLEVEVEIIPFLSIFVYDVFLFMMFITAREK